MSGNASFAAIDPDRARAGSLYGAMGAGDTATKRPPKMAYIQATIVVFNLIMGSGILAAPRAFYMAGYGLGIALLAIMGFFAYCSILWLFECQLRAQALNSLFVRGMIRVVPFNATVEDSDSSAGNESDGGDAHKPKIGTSQRSIDVGGGVVVSYDAGSMPPKSHRSSRSSSHAEDMDAEDTAQLVPVTVEDAVNHPGQADPSSVSMQQVSGSQRHLNAVVYDPAHAGDKMDAGEETTTPFVIAAKAQISQTWLGMYDVEAVASKEEIAAAIDYDALDADYEYLEQDHSAAVCGGKPAAFAFNLSQVLFQNAGNWVYMVVLPQVAVLTIPLPGYTDFLECNVHDEKAFADHPRCTHAMRIYIAIFTVVFLVSMLRNWQVIAYFQRLATIVTYIALAIMVSSCAYGMTQQPFDPEASDKRIQSVPAADTEHFSELFGVAAFCLLCHPGSTLMLRNMPRRKDTAKVYAMGFSLILLLYCVVSIVIAFYMGSSVSPVMNISWINFGKTWGKVDSTPLRVLGIIVVMFPLFSITACYILYLRALSESMEAFTPISIRQRIAALFNREYHGPDVSLYPVSHVFRFIAVMVPAILAMITFKFAKAIAVAGFFAFFLMFFSPALMQLYSKRLMKKLGIPPSPHETILGHNAAVIFIACFCVLAEIYYVWKQMIPALEAKNS